MALRFILSPLTHCGVCGKKAEPSLEVDWPVRQRCAGPETIQAYPQCPECDKKEGRDTSALEQL